MTNLVQKQISYQNIDFNTISVNGNIYIEFANLCNLLELSDSYYYKKFSNISVLEKAFIKHFVSGKRGLSNKNFIDVTYLDAFINNLGNSHHNDNYELIKNNISDIINHIISEYGFVTNNNSGFEMIISTQNIQAVEFHDKNFICIKKENDSKIYIALKHMFKQIGLDLTNYLNIFRDNKELLNALSRTNIDGVNVVLFNINSIKSLISNLKQRVTNNINFDLIETSLVPHIINSFSDKNVLKIPKTYMETLSLLINSEEKNTRIENENMLLKLEIEELRNKALMYDKTLSTVNLQDMKQISSVFGIGRNKLFTILRERKILIEGGESHNLPYQKYINSGYFIVRRVVINRTAGREMKNQTLVTPKGVGFINRLFKTIDIESITA